MFVNSQDSDDNDVDDGPEENCPTPSASEALKAAEVLNLFVHSDLDDDTMKKEIPIRPVVVHCNSPSYKIAKWLNKYHKEVTGFRTKHTIKNSKDQVDKIQNTQVNEGYKLKTMDIENLFTNIPTENLTELRKKNL
ncbi:hypothetical protein HHI36_019876 [Cryptolaemus montrouzieri]|uniref:Reverse transcriptase domain-containing protein n=1 Tax=Cryptolaemus montrouzieri TaxID=559131 RepID=A0ABD2N9P6_9CUCU